MNKKKALILIGYQNDYFAKDGILSSVVEASAEQTLQNTLKILDTLQGQIPIITTPIIFTKDYRELIEPVGILKTIKEVQAFKEGTFGASNIPELDTYMDKIIEIPGKVGLNAFMNTDLDKTLKDLDVTEVVLMGCVSSICIDSTGRSAFEKGYQVRMITDCISGRSIFEQDFYNENVFPLYATIEDTDSFLSSF